MLSNFLAKLKSLFAQKTYGERLEEYIVSKNPTSTYDVDHWTRQYDRNNSNKPGWISMSGWMS